MPFKIWQHPQGEMTVKEYVRRLAEMDKKNIDELKRAALDKAEAEAEAPAKARKKKASSGG
ncbi:MAG TPA: hypothetical protein VFU76_01075 [Terriglobales bacterium]|nr:hypothetical protein [Terriglobales bacterium]